MKEVLVRYYIYSIDELSIKAREKAYAKWLEDYDYPWGKENRDTLKAFEKLFPIKVLNWEYGMHENYITFEVIDDDIKNLSGVRLLKYLYNNYFSLLVKSKVYHHPKNPTKQRISKVFYYVDRNLTGYYLDYDILDPLYEFMKNPVNITFEALMSRCLNSWVQACGLDYEYCISFKEFIEVSNANNWMYFEDGTKANFSKGTVVDELNSIPKGI